MKILLFLSIFINFYQSQIFFLFCFSDYQQIMFYKLQNKYNNNSTLFCFHWEKEKEPDQSVTFTVHNDFKILFIMILKSWDVNILLWQLNKTVLFLTHDNFFFWPEHFPPKKMLPTSEFSLKIYTKNPYQILFGISHSELFL